MAEPETKLARLVSWVRMNMDREGAFPKSNLYSFARSSGIERSALEFLYRCRSKGTMRDQSAKRVQVLVPIGANLEEFYKDLLKIQDEPVLQGRPKPPRRKSKEPASEKPKELPQQKTEQPVTPVPRQQPPDQLPNLANAIAEKLEERFKGIDHTVASIGSLVGRRMNDFEQRVSVVIVKELEKRIKQLEAQLEQYRAKAEAFDLIKRDAWEIVQALEIVEKEREDVKKVLKKFL
jgi:hypothetical protein